MVTNFLDGGAAVYFFVNKITSNYRIVDGCNYGTPNTNLIFSKRRVGNGTQSFYINANSTTELCFQRKVRYLKPLQKQVVTTALVLEKWALGIRQQLQF
jgi:hypothetical protein